jgi:SpoVK/Ycf46/Vps4 family AAA+-type ATPase
MHTKNGEKVMRIGTQSYNSLAVYKNNQQKSNNINYKKMISFKGDDSDTFDYDARIKEKLKGKSWINKVWNGLEQKAKDETVFELIGFNIARNALDKEKDQTIRAKEEALKAKEDAVKIAREKSELLEKQLAEALKNGENSAKLALMQRELDDMKAQQSQKQIEFIKEAEEYQRAKEAIKTLTEVKNGKGWDRIAGSTRIKKQLEEFFINKLALEQGNVNVTLPNGILIYGPKGTGKTWFAEAFAQQAGCHFVEIDMMQDDKDIIKDLQEAGENAKKLYKNNNKQRTIILLDEFDSVAALSDEEKQKSDRVLDDKPIGKLKKFINNCADKYKCTLFLTTNHPLAIDSELIDDERINKAIYLGPPSKEDTAAVLKHYMKGQTDQEIDYDESSNVVMQSREDNQGFSIRRLQKVVKNCVDASVSTGQKITQQDLAEQIKKLGPDLSSEIMDKYTQETAMLIEKMS